MAEPGKNVADPRKRSLAEYAFLASVAIAIAGTIIALGGLASMQAFCDSNNGIFAGMKPKYLGQAKLVFISCAAQWRFEWWGWALQVFFLAVTLLCYVTGNVHNYKSALWSLAATVIAIAMIYANELIDLYDKTQGDLHVRGIITFLGYGAFCAGDYLMMFTGNALYHIKRAEYLQNKSDAKLEGITLG